MGAESSIPCQAKGYRTYDAFLLCDQRAPPLPAVTDQKDPNTLGMLHQGTYQASNGAGPHAPRAACGLVDPTRPGRGLAFFCAVSITPVCARRRRQEHAVGDGLRHGGAVPLWRGGNGRIALEHGV